MRRADIKAVEAGSGAKGNFNLASLIAVILFAICNAAAKDLPRTSEPAAPAIAASRRELVISVPDRKMALIEDGQVVKVYAVAVGKSTTPSPTGHFKVVNRIVKPTYYHKGVVVGPGRANPLGNRWMGLDLKGYGIHGTNEPGSIGHAASHGCIRMGKRDVEDLFNRVQVGDNVEIVASTPTELATAFESQPKAHAELKSASKPITQELRAAIADAF